MIQLASKKAHGEVYIGAIRLTIEAYFKAPTGREGMILYPCMKRPDIDNIVKIVMDAGNNILWEDDSQIVHIDAMKQWGINERLEITVRYL